MLFFRPSRSTKHMRLFRAALAFVGPWRRMRWFYYSGGASSSLIFFAIFTRRVTHRWRTSMMMNLFSSMTRIGSPIPQLSRLICARSGARPITELHWLLLLVGLSAVL